MTGIASTRRWGRTFAACLLLLAAVSGRAEAQAATTPFQSTYHAYNFWEWQSNNCNQTQPIYGSEPSAPGTYPVLLYMHGTLADWGGNEEGKRVADLAAAQGFVAAGITYDSWVANGLPAINGNAKCIFAAATNGNALANVCARPKADCSKGVLVAGFSAGGAIAARAKNYAPSVVAAWLMGVSGPAVQDSMAPPAGIRALPNDRVRISVGASDVTDIGTMNKLTGLNCTGSPCDGPGGSGYYIVQNSEVADGSADHCYWQSVNTFAPTNSCTWTPTFDPGFTAPSTKPWSLTTNLNWLRSKLP
jgi:poly(3-hydroxybutyrate) depolymerase